MKGADATTCGNSCRARKSKGVVLDQPEDIEALGAPYIVEGPQLVLSEQQLVLSEQVDRMLFQNPLRFLSQCKNFLVPASMA